MLTSGVYLNIIINSHLFCVLVFSSVLSKQNFTLLRNKSSVRSDAGRRTTTLMLINLKQFEILGGQGIDGEYYLFFILKS